MQYFFRLDIKHKSYIIIKTIVLNYNIMVLWNQLVNLCYELKYENYLRRLK